MSQFQIICLRCIWFSSNVPIMQRFLLFFPRTFSYFFHSYFGFYSSVIAVEMQSKFQQNKQNNVDLQ